MSKDINAITSVSEMTWFKSVSEDYREAVLEVERRVQSAIALDMTAFLVSGPAYLTPYYITVAQHWGFVFEQAFPVLAMQSSQSYLQQLSLIFTRPIAVHDEAEGIAL